MTQPHVRQSEQVTESGRPGPAGPVATPSPQVWADPSRRRVLRVLAAHADPVPLAVVVHEVGGHPNTTRGHLDALRAAGLVRRGIGPHPVRGRPPWLHGLTDVGRSVVRRLDDPDAGLDLEALALAFIRHLRTLPDPSGTARQVGRTWAESLRAHTRARTRAGRARALVDHLDRMGFTPVPAGRPVGSESDSAGSDPGVSTDELVLRSCPLLESASANTEVVCQIHLGLAEGVLAEGGDVEQVGVEQVDVELEPWGRPQGCRLLLTWREQPRPV